MGFEFVENSESGVNIKVIGIGGGGSNAVNRMISTNVRGADFIAINTDKQALVKSGATHKIPIGEKVTKGHGAGSKPDVGERAAEESIEEIRSALTGADMVFITAGMGGGTGTGAAPVVARVAQEMGVLTVGIATKPFAFEGKQRMAQAETGIANLRQYVDSLVVIPNERLKQVSDKPITMMNAFEIADDVLSHGVQSISELINIPGYINLDFADVTSVMKGAGYAHMGIGEATGKDKAEMAAKAAISSPLLETSISGAKGVIISITASPDISLDDIDLTSTMISTEAHEDATVIWGVSFDPDFEDKMKVTIIATGFENVNENGTPTMVAKKVETKKPEPIYKAPVTTAAPAVKPVETKQAANTVKSDEASANDEEQSSESDDDNVDESVLSDDEISDIISILKKEKTNGNNSQSNYPGAGAGRRW